MSADHDRNVDQTSVNACAAGSASAGFVHLGHHVDQDGAVLGAVNASALARRPRMPVHAASGIDRASAQLRLGHYVMADAWLSLTPNFVQAYAAVISLVSSRHPLRIAQCGARDGRHPRIPPARTSQTNNAAPVFDPGPTSHRQRFVPQDARPIDPRQ